MSRPVTFPTPDPMSRVFAALGPRTEGGVNPPISDSSTFAFPDPEAMHRFIAGEIPEGFIYARHMTPETAALAVALAALEGTEAAHVTASGMAAIAAVLLHHCRAGDEIVAGRAVYGGTYALFTVLLARFGIRTRFVDLRDLAAVEAAVGPRTRVLYGESISNPLLGVPDLEALGRLARDRGTLLVVDNTFSPLLLSPARHGAHVVVHSLTKFINGAGDGMGGAVCTEREGVEALLDVTEGTALMLGATLDGHRAASIRKNLATLHLRMARHGKNALGMARALEDVGLPVSYPGLPSHPDHERMDRLRNPGYGFGGMLTVDLGDEARASRVAARWQDEGVGSVAVSLGYHRTLITAPATSTSSELPPDEREAMGMSPGLLRLSVGLDPDLDPVLDRMIAVLEEEGAVPAAGTASGGRGVG